MEQIGRDFAVSAPSSAPAEQLADRGLTLNPTIEDGWFSVVPSSATASAVAHLWREIWRYNAVQAVSVAADGLGQPLHRLHAAVCAVNLEQRLAPRLSAWLASLMEAMQRGDGYAVHDIVQAWCLDPPTTWAVDQIVTESIASHAWEVELLSEVRGTRVQNVAPLTLFPLLETDLTPLHAAAMQALALIAEADPAMHDEIQAHVSLIKLFSGPGVEGFSSPKAFGAIWLRLPEPGGELAWFLEHLVHECSHLHLNALLALDPLLLNPDELHQAPIRPDPRPLFQVLHGTFVLWRNCRVHRRLVKRHPELGLQLALTGFEEQLARGLEVIHARVQPTTRGRLLLDSFLSDLH